MEQPDQGTDIGESRDSPDSTVSTSRTRAKALKTALRATIRNAREQRSAADREAFATRLAQWEPPEGTKRVSFFVGVGSEPDTGPLLDRLSERGIEVLLPITLDDFSLDWALYSGRENLVDARFGLLEPTGPRLGRDAIATADVVVIPALAIDTDGRRLGQGAGCYDRALPHVAQTTPVLGVVYDDERVSEPLPQEPHDRGVDGIIP
jgi:5-formyltetrahydrofolate cyclo-ligase